MRKIIFLAIIISISFTISSAQGKAACPENTNWDGTNCINSKTGESIIFTDYTGNPVIKSKQKIQETQIQSTNTAPRHEILRDIMIIKPEIILAQDQRGKALEQKIRFDKQGPTNLDRSNYDFSKVMKWSAKNAISTFNKIVLGKQIQNSDYGKNHKHQIEYQARYERFQDPILQQNIIYENQRAQKTFFINWGNFTNH